MAKAQRKNGGASKMANVTRVVLEEGDLRMILEIAGRHRLSEKTKDSIRSSMRQAIWDEIQSDVEPFMHAALILDSREPIE